jgi:hypothetical protein
MVGEFLYFCKKTGMDKIVYKDGMYTLGEKDGLAWLEVNGIPLKLTCQPYEPCMYITQADGKTTTVHNAFDPSVALDLFASGGTMSSITGRVYRVWDFCGLVWNTVTYWGPQEVQIDDAERNYIKVLKGAQLQFPPIAQDAIRLEKAKTLLSGVLVGELSLDIVRYIYVIGIIEPAQTDVPLFGQLGEEEYYHLRHHDEITDWDPLEGDISPAREPLEPDGCRALASKHPLCGGHAGDRNSFGPEDLAAELVYCRGKG